jgi:hypothetical protein
MAHCGHKPRTAHAPKRGAHRWKAAPPRNADLRWASDDAGRRRCEKLHQTGPEMRVRHDLRHDLTNAPLEQTRRRCHPRRGHTREIQGRRCCSAAAAYRASEQQAERASTRCQAHEPERNSRQQGAGAPSLRIALVVEQQRCGRAASSVRVRVQTHAAVHPVNQVRAPSDSPAASWPSVRSSWSSSADNCNGTRHWRVRRGAQHRNSKTRIRRAPQGGPGRRTKKVTCSKSPEPSALNCGAPPRSPRQRGARRVTTRARRGAHTREAQCGARRTPMHADDVWARLGLEQRDGGALRRAAPLRRAACAHLTRRRRSARGAASTARRSSPGVAGRCPSRPRNHHPGPGPARRAARPRRPCRRTAGPCAARTRRSVSARAHGAAAAPRSASTTSQAQKR